MFEITPVDSTIKFDVEASVAITGKFGKWDATLTFTSTDLDTGVLDIKISGSQRGHRKRHEGWQTEGQRLLRRRAQSDDHISLNQDRTNWPRYRDREPGFELDGDFTIRGVTKQEKLTLTVSGRGGTSGTVKGTMAFDRKQCGMNSGIPFIKIADRVAVTINLKLKRVSGPPVNLKQ